MQPGGGREEEQAGPPSAMAVRQTVVEEAVVGFVGGCSPPSPAHHPVQLQVRAPNSPLSSLARLAPLGLPRASLSFELLA